MRALALVLLFIIAAVALYDALEPSAPTVTAPPDLMAARVAAAASALPVLRRMLRNPQSFVLVAVGSPGAGIACYEYRAQNGFGGTNLDHAVLADGKVQLQGTGAFTAAWKRHCSKVVPDITQDLKRVQDLFPDR